MPRTQSGTSKKRTTSRRCSDNKTGYRNVVFLGRKDVSSERSNITFALDTNILMTQPDAMFSFHEHNVFVPWEVLLELDHAKSGTSERSMNARRSISFLLHLATSVLVNKVGEGVPLLRPGENSKKAKKKGRLFFGVPRTEELEARLNKGNADHRILLECLRSKKEEGENVVLVTKDKAMRIFALLVGIQAEDYFNDAVDVENLRSTGVCTVSRKLWKGRKSINAAGKFVLFELKGREISGVAVNEFLNVDGGEDLRVVKKLSPHKVLVKPVVDYEKVHHVFGIRARSRFQNYALNALMDPEISLVILEGPAGSGKNFLTLAAAFHQSVDCKITKQRGAKFKPYRKIIATRDAVPVGREIGFKPGSEKSKMEQWMGGMMDNLNQLVSINKDVQGISQNKLKELIELKELNSMRGRSFYRDFLIFDEAQNSFREQLKLFLTRVGEGCKVVCLGNFSQTDISLAGRTSGLERIIDITRNWGRSAHIVLPTVERGDVAAFFEANL